MHLKVMQKQQLLQNKNLLVKERKKEQMEVDGNEQDLDGGNGKEWIDAYKWWTASKYQENNGIFNKFASN